MYAAEGRLSISSTTTGAWRCVDGLGMERDSYLRSFDLLVVKLGREEMPTVDGSTSRIDSLYFWKASEPRENLFEVDLLCLGVSCFIGTGVSVGPSLLACYRAIYSDL